MAARAHWFDDEEVIESAAQVAESGGRAELKL